MNINNLDPNNKIVQCWANKPSEYEDMLSFQKWFDAASSLEQVVNQSKNDWNNRIANFDLFSNLKKNTCLEIGFGGGRLIYQASKVFKYSFGIDIHSNFSKTEEFLSSYKTRNYKLLHRNNANSLPKNCFDFIFSFIVFQHFHNLEEVDFYLDIIKSRLNKDGVAHIFFGKSKTKNHKVESDDRFKERNCSLWLDPELFRDRVSNMGFEIIEYQNLMPKKNSKPIGPKNISGQARVLFKLKQ